MVLTQRHVCVLGVVKRDYLLCMCVCVCYILKPYHYIFISDKLSNNPVFIISFLTRYMCVVCVCACLQIWTDELFTLATNILSQNATRNTFLLKA